jgi:acetoin utilization protein AcuC
MAGKKIFIHCRKLEQLPYPASCPFNTSRAGKVKNLLDSMDLLTGDDRQVLEPVAAERGVLEKFHSAQYLESMQQAEAGQFEGNMLGMGLGTGDCPVFEGMYEYGALAAGATVAGAEKILAGAAVAAFNPSGGLHHAHSGRASGFCYINDVVLGCMRLAEGGKKVLYLDVDVHHGDGVQGAFYDRCDVMTVSFHQDGRTLFPGTGFVNEIGTGDGVGYSVNVPMPPGTYDGAYLKAFEAIVPPLIAAFGPDAFVMEIGTDALADDPLAAVCLTNNVYVEIIQKLLQFNKPILATGGGGYNIENTVRAWALAWTALCGDQDAAGRLRDKNRPEDESQDEYVLSAVENVIEEVKRNVFSYHGL